MDVQAIETDFGKCNIMLDNDVPADTLLVVSLEECVPVFLEIPGKGTFFAEPLAKTGALDRVQIYGRDRPQVRCRAAPRQAEAVVIDSGGGALSIGPASGPTVRRTHREHLLEHLP